MEDFTFIAVTLTNFHISSGFCIGEDCASFCGCLSVEVNKICNVGMTAECTGQVGINIAGSLIIICCKVCLCVVCLLESVSNNTKIHGFAENVTEIIFISCVYRCKSNIVRDCCKISFIILIFFLFPIVNLICLNDTALCNYITVFTFDYIGNCTAFCCLYQSGLYCWFITSQTFTCIQIAIVMTPVRFVNCLHINIGICGSQLFHIIVYFVGLMVHFHKQIQIITLCNFSTIVVNLYIVGNAVSFEINCCNITCCGVAYRAVKQDIICIVCFNFTLFINNIGISFWCLIRTVGTGRENIIFQIICNCICFLRPILTIGIERIKTNYSLISSSYHARRP